MTLLKCILLALFLFPMIILDACSSDVESLPAKDFSDATVYFRKFDTSTPVALDEITLKRAYDVSFVLNKKSDIDKLYDFLSAMNCKSAPQVIDDIRVLIEFRKNDRNFLKWRSSFFNYVDFHGNICHLHDSKREELERLIIFLDKKQKG